MLPVEMLSSILKAIKESYQMTLDTMEISIEVNPATINLKQLQQLRKCGFNRLSIGTQSFNDKELALIGRTHLAVDTVHTVRDAKEAGFDNINIDLMYGLPHQSINNWQSNLEKALALSPQHLSIYELTLEPETPLYNAVRQGKVTLAEEEIILSMMNQTENTLSSTFFSRYEISNYSLHDYQCQHNVNYWHNGSYLGLGPGAVASHAGKRWAIDKNIQIFCDKISAGNCWESCETLDKESFFRETVIMGLRLIAGVNIDSLHKRFQIDPIKYYGDTLNTLINQGFVLHDGRSLCLSNKGLAIANSVMAQLV